MATETALQTQTPLVAADAIIVRQEMGLVPVGEVRDLSGDNELLTQANQFVNALLDVNPQDEEQKSGKRAAVETMGKATQQEAVHTSRLLENPIRDLAKRGEDGGEVATSLIDLKVQVESLDPGDLDFKSGWLGRILGIFFGKPINRYFSKYESAQSIIDAIIRSLKDGANQLRRDNDTLKDDQARMREATLRLEKSIQLGLLIDQKLEEKLKSDFAPDDIKAQYIQEELLFPLRQRIQDLQQQLVTNQNGVLTMEIIIRNNKELIRGVDRAVNVTVTALQIAVAASLALANQKIVLEKIESVNKTTDDLILSTSRQLREQGVAVHKQASSTQLNMESLREAFRNINAAMEDISNFRREALPQMKSVIDEMVKMTAEAEQSIKKMEEGNKAQSSLVIDIS